MARLLRRFLVLAALMFWQGGFTFYAAVVVPVGQEVLGPPAQASVTRHVTIYLNLAGAVALLPLAWDAAFSRDRQPWRRRGRWLAWVGMALTLAALVWLHGHLDRLLDDPSGVDRAAFRTVHRLYLWVSTAQWACALAYAALALFAWRDEDRPPPNEVVG
jgi:hypothetical protein